MAVVSLKLCRLVLAVAVVTSAPMVADAAVTCGQVTSSLTPCIPYLQSGGMVPPGCCNGVRSLNAAATTTPDRQAACKCLQQAAKAISGINMNLASSLPGKCGVSIPYPISQSVDCSIVR